MLPTLSPGQLLLVDRRRAGRVGDVVLALDPRSGVEVVKRLTAIEADGFWLEGDAHDPRTAASSADSWVFGAVPALTGVVILPRSGTP